MSKKKIERARQLIRSGNLKAARKILITLPNDERAQRWIDEIDYRLERDKRGKPAAKAKKNRNATCLSIVAVLIAALVCVFSLSQSGQQASNSVPPTGIGTLSLTAVPTNTQAPAPTATATESSTIESTTTASENARARIDEGYDLGEQLKEVFYLDPNVLFVRLAFLATDGDGYQVYTEVDVNRGFVNVQMAERLLSYAQASFKVTEFATILNDGASIPTSFMWNARRGWWETRLDTIGIVPVITPTLDG